MRKFLSSVVIATSFFINFLPALAQTAPAEELQELTAEEEANLFPALPEQIEIPNTTACFDDYRFGSVQTDISPAVLSTVPGIPITFSGKIINDNPYPIVDGSVYIKIFKKQATHSNTDLNTKQNGPEVVDQFFAKENISIKANDSTPILFVWNIPRNAESGDYQTVTYFVTAKRFNLSGLSFTDDVTGNKVDFSIKSDVINPPAYFNKNTVTLNQQPHKFAIFPLHFPKEENVTAEVELVNPSKQDKTITLNWKLYKWDGLRDENKKDEKTETITLKGSETKKLSYTVNKDTGSVAYLVAQAQDKESKSILNIRFVREGIEETRLNFPSITSYPLTQGQENSLFSCVHSTNTPIVKDNTLTLTLKTLSGETIHQYIYQGDISGEMMGVKGAFTPKETVQNFTLTATLKNQGNTIEEVTQTYLCDKLGDNCPKETISSSSQPSDFLNFGENGMWLKLVLFLVGAVLLFFIIRRMVMKRSNSAFSFFFAFLIVTSLFFGGVERVEGKNKQAKAMVNGWLYGVGLFISSDLSDLRLSSNKANSGINAPYIFINYDAYATDSLGNLLLDGVNVPVGSQVKFQFKPYENSDISWFGSGYYADSPYGRWVNGAKAPTGPLGRISVGYNAYGEIVYREKYVCDPYDYVYTFVNSWGGKWELHLPLSVHPPIKSFIPSTNLNCGNSDANGDVICLVTGTGPISADMKFNATYARFYNRANINDPRNTPVPGCYGTNIPTDLDPNNVHPGPGLPPGPPFTIPIPAATINFAFNAEAGNRPPLPPTVTNNLDGMDPAGTDYKFDAVTTDPDGDQIRYGFNWTGAKDVSGNYIVEEWKPLQLPLNYVDSGVSQNAVHPWYVSGIKEFRVNAQDHKGAYSGWTTHRINIMVNQPPTIPDVTGPSSGEPGISYTFFAKSSDPEGDRLRYGFDWDNNAVRNSITGVVTGIDEWTNYVDSSVYRNNYTPSPPHPWPTLGPKDFKVFAQDENSYTSLPKSKQIIIACDAGVSEIDNGCSVETKTRTTKSFDSVAGKCKSEPETIAYTASEKNACRDFNYREVAP